MAYSYIDSPEKVGPALEKLKLLGDTFGVDTETTGLDPLTEKVLLIQVGIRNKQYVFDTYRVGGEIYKLLNWLKRPQITKIFHNAKFDYEFIKSNFGIELKNIKCTYIAERLLTMGKRVKLNLADVSNKYLRRADLSKDEQTSFVGMKLGDEFTDEQIRYAAEDVAHLKELYKNIENLIKKRDMTLLAKIEFQSIEATAEMELNGIYLHPKRWMELEEKAQKKLDETRKELDKIFLENIGKDKISTTLFGKPDVNYGSPQQVKPLLERVIGYKIKDTGEDTLQQIDHIAAEKILDYRDASTKISRYGIKFFRKNAHPKTKRIHSNFLQLGTDTGRYASRGPNLQNIPNAKEYRAAFTAQSPDYKIIAADFSQQELRLLAYISQDPVFLQAIEEGKDIHCMAASLLFDVPYKDFFDKNGNRREDMDKKYRKPAKSLNFGLIYGMGAGRLARQLKVTYREAQSLINRYFRLFPSISDKLDEFEKFVLENHYAFSPIDKRRIDLSGIDWDHPGHVAHAKNQAKNFPFQGAGATVTKLAMCKIKKNIDIHDYDARLLVAVHDEVVLEVRKDQAEEVARMVESKMIKAFNRLAPGIKMKVDAEIGDCWIH